MVIDKDFIIKWSATTISVAGAVCVAMDYYPLGAIMCLLETLLWLVVSIQMKESFMVTSNTVLLIIYVGGMSYKHYLGG
jgi:hypothetical protein